MQDWRGKDVETTESADGVIALANPWENVIRPPQIPWPPPELIQKIYESPHSSAYRGAANKMVTRALGFYSDLQSIHSEDAITWSIFGPIAYSTVQVRISFTRALLEMIEIPCEKPTDATIWLWRRIPHPDKMMSTGGPEVDFGIQTDTVFLLGEAKWRSSVAAHQGTARNKTQIDLRRDFCQKYGRKILPTCRHFVVLGLSLLGGIVPILPDDTVEGVTLHARDATWAQLAAIYQHPLASEVRDYLAWKQRHSKKLERVQSTL